jgi:hypothetical protein
MKHALLMDDGHQVIVIAQQRWAKKTEVHEQYTQVSFEKN